MITLAGDLEAFATDLTERIRQEESILVRSARRALHRYGQEDWYRALLKHVEALARLTYRQQSDRLTSAQFREALAEFNKTLVETMERTTEPDPSTIEKQAHAIAGSLATAAISLGYEAAAKEDEEPERLGKVWITMADERVRPTHAAAEGQTVPLGGTFTVGGAELSHPGDMSGPIEEWINCRCFIGIDYFMSESLAAAGTDQGDIMDEPQVEALIDVAETVPWHGVLAPENVVSGDGRKFATDTLRWRDLPLPLSWQKINDDGHRGSVVVGRIDNIWRDEGLIKAEGYMLATTEADEVIGIMADNGLRGVSVDVDDAEMELQDEAGNSLTLSDAMESDTKITQVLTSGRVCGATLCPIPAFQEAFVLLGEWEEGLHPEEPDVIKASATVTWNPATTSTLSAGQITFNTSGGWCSPSETEEEFKDYPMEERRKMAEKGQALPDGSFPIANEQDLRNAIQSIGRAKDPAKAKAHIKKRARALGLTDLIPEGWADEEVEEFVKTEDGPGWLTHPVDTDRLRDYWTHGAGAAKIGWGTPGDFNRCRANLAKYVKPQYLSGYCANRHYDALGFWPGDHARMDKGHSLKGGESMHLALVASADRPPVEWFSNPNFTGKSPLCITEDGRIFGHVAAWGTCHIGFDGVCVTPPENFTDYAYFKTGLVVCSDGTEVQVGQITMDTGHAPQRMGARPAAAHYDNTGAVVADIAVGEDEFGIWYSGRMRPSATEEQIDALRAAGHVSGDWREIGGNLELIAALAVNVGGFPIPRTQIAASGGRQTALIASGIVMQKDPVGDRLRGGPITNRTLKEIVSEAVSEKISTMQRREALKQLAIQTKRDPKSRMLALAEERRK